MATVCQNCGGDGFEELMLICDCCKIMAVHRYCMGIMPIPYTLSLTWICEDCAGSDWNSDSDSEEVGQIDKYTRILKKIEKIKKKKMHDSNNHNLLPVLADDHELQDDVEPVEVSSSSPMSSSPPIKQAMEPEKEQSSDSRKSGVNGDRASVLEDEHSSSIPDTRNIPLTETRQLADENPQPEVPKLEEKKHYRGVRQRCGKFSADIWDLNKHKTLWLGTFDTAIEAARAYDKAAFRLRRSKAILNFPLEVGKSVEDEKKRMRDEFEDVTVVEKVSKRKQRSDSRKPHEFTGLDGDGASVSEDEHSSSVPTTRNIPLTESRQLADENPQPEVPKPEEKKHYRGVRQKRKKFVAEIGKGGGRVWLGSFGTAIEAARAYDEAAFRFQGSKAVLNFPLEVGKSVPSSLEDEKKRKRDEVEDVTVVEKVSKREQSSDCRKPHDFTGLDGDGASVDEHSSSVPTTRNIPLTESRQVADENPEVPKPEEKKHYRGVRLKRGRFVAEIRNPNKSRARVWLGSFGTAIEAAKAYDEAALRFQGSMAILNFPLEVGKSVARAVEDEKKRKRHEDEDVSVVKKVSKREHSRKPGEFTGLDGNGASVSEEKKHYKGVRQRRSGKFGAQIRAPNKSRSRISLGTFDTAIEAARAYDKTAFRLRGSKAILNFPLEVEKWIEDEKKQKRDEDEDETVVEKVSKREQSSDSRKPPEDGTGASVSKDELSCVPDHNLCNTGTIQLTSVKTYRALPIKTPRWRGSISVEGENSRNIDGIVAHVSNLACPRVHETAGSLQCRLSAEMFPRSEIWPKSFQKNGGPKDDHVALFFFPSSESHEKEAFYSLVRDMKDNDFAMRCVLDDAELLLFTSYMLPIGYWTFNSTHYLWGVFKPKQTSRH